jgi:hypothetical protein
MIRSIIMFFLFMFLFSSYNVWPASNKCGNSSLCKKIKALIEKAEQVAEEKAKVEISGAVYKDKASDYEIQVYNDLLDKIRILLSAMPNKPVETYNKEAASLKDSATLIKKVIPNYFKIKEDLARSQHQLAYCISLLVLGENADKYEIDKCRACNGSNDSICSQLRAFDIAFHYFSYINADRINSSFPVGTNLNADAMVLLRALEKL